MEDLLLEILDELRHPAHENSEGYVLDDNRLAQLVRKHNAQRNPDTQPFAKKRLLPYYQHIKQTDPTHWAQWNIDDDLEQRLIQTLRMKPRRTASGVATITVLTKPWPCRGTCIYCPNDLRMPKSYLADEPACQRAERNWFDPYLQVTARLHALIEMGHVTDKVELIILGGTWSDYSPDYQVWFVRELFRALNDGDSETAHHVAEARRKAYHNTNIPNLPDEAAARVAHLQHVLFENAHLHPSAAPAYRNADPSCCKQQATQDSASAKDFTYVEGFSKAEGSTNAENAAFTENAASTENTTSTENTAFSEEYSPDALDVTAQQQTLTYNQAIQQLYLKDSAWSSVSAWQHASLDDLAAQHTINENAQHRCVGLVVETRPNAITAESLTLLRRLGCTKVQMGIQSLNPTILSQNTRTASVEDIQNAFELLRVFGFKTHVHAMVNLYGSSPDEDLRDYRRLVEDTPYQPDEIKLYPCVLVDGTNLMRYAQQGMWRPYHEDELVDVLAKDVLATPPFTRISRMIRDISAHDIVAGNKKTNLRQMVEVRAEELAQTLGEPLQEMRHREVSTHSVNQAALSLSVLSYRTTATEERFFQWVTPENHLAGFLRLSLPFPSYLRARTPALPILPGEAMIREVHVYGKVAGLQTQGQNAQHRGLGRQLIQAACDAAREQGFTAVNVISAVGTRAYYRSLGFTDNGLYQQIKLIND